MKKAPPSPPKDSIDPERLLDMWMGPDTVAPRPKRSSAFLDIVGAVVLIGGIIALAKYAADVLVLLVGLAIAIFVIHELMQMIARSDLLSPGSLVIVILLVGLLAWLFVPNKMWVDWGNHLPAPVARFLGWAEEHGWGGTAFVASPSPEPSGGLAAGPPAPVSSTPASARPTATAAAAKPAVTIALSATSAQTRFGEPVTFVARVSGPGGTTLAGATVRFYDGSTVIGMAVVRQEGPLSVAYLTVATLSPGEHDIRAEMAAAPIPSGAASAALRHTVTR